MVKLLTYPLRAVGWLLAAVAAAIVGLVAVVLDAAGLKVTAATIQARYTELMVAVARQFRMLFHYIELARARTVFIQKGNWYRHKGDVSMVCPVCGSWFELEVPVRGSGELDEPMHCPECDFEANIHLKGWRP